MDGVAAATSQRLFNDAYCERFGDVSEDCAEQGPSISTDEVATPSVSTIPRKSVRRKLQTPSGSATHSSPSAPYESPPFPPKSRIITSSVRLRSSLIFVAIFAVLLVSFSSADAARLDEKKCTRNSINLGNIIDSLLKDYDIHLLPEAEGVNVTIELHVQVSLLN